MLLVKLFSYLPYPLLYALSDVLAWLLHTVIRYRRQVIYDNLRHSFPEQTEAWYRKTIKAFYRSFTDTWLEALKVLSMSEEDMKARVDIQNPELTEGYAQKGLSTIGLTGHNANWEYLLLRGSLSVKQVVAVYLRVNNPFFDKLMYRIRNRYGIQLVEKAELLRVMVKTRGQIRNLAMVADQSPIGGKGSNRHWQVFMNRPAPFFNAAEKMVRKEALPVYYVGIKRNRRGHYTIWYEELGFPPYDQLPDGELTSRYIQALERNIRLQPELYLWSHKRWKHRPEADTPIYTATPTDKA